MNEANNGKTKQALILLLTSALPLLVLSVLYLWPVVNEGHYLLNSNQHSLGDIIEIESTVLFSGIFLSFPLIGSLLWEEKSLARLIILGSCFIGFIALFASMVWSTNGFYGALSYLFLAFVTFGGITIFIPSTSDIKAAFMCLVRWVFALFVAFLPARAFSDLPKFVSQWSNSSDIVLMGAIFFSILFALEIFLFIPLQLYLSMHFLKTGSYSNMPDPADDPELAKIIERRQHYRKMMNKLSKKH